MHWPANAGGEHPDRDTIYRLPGVAQGALLMCADSARFWYGEARSRCPLVVWRGLPRPGHLPAQLGWKTEKVADEVLNLWSEQNDAHTGTEWFVPLNELQIDKESGESWRGYSYMVARLAALRVELRSRLPESVKLLFPPWVPSDDGDRASEWVSEAQQWDGAVLHAYGSAGDIVSRYWAYRGLLGLDLPILIGEWNANHSGADEQAAVASLGAIADADPAFLGACHYIWETHNDGEQDLSVWGNSSRLALFQNPPARTGGTEQPATPSPEAQEPPEAPAPPSEPAAPDLPPVEAPVTTPPDPWQFWTVEQIAAAIGCPLENAQANWPKVVEQLGHCDLTDRPVQLAAAGTIAAETQSFLPIEEYRNADGSIPSYWHDYGGGPDFHGRGFIQLTHDYNYRAYGEAVRQLWGAGADDPTFDLVAHPENALDPDIAAAVLAVYFRDHNGGALVTAARAGDWTEVRREVNGGTGRLDVQNATIAALDASGPAEAPQTAPSATVAVLTYNPNTPPERQVSDYACSIRTAAWMLKSLGVDVTAPGLEAEMVPLLVTPEDGLLDGHGNGLAAELKRHLPDGTDVEVTWAPTWDDVVSRAGRGPIGIGAGQPLYHWLAVASVQDAVADVPTTLVTANPAPNYPPDAPLGDLLTRAQFEQYAPWAMLFVETIPAATEPAPAPEEQPGNGVTPPVPDPAPAGPSLETLVGVAYNDDGTVIPALLDAEQQTDAAAMRDRIEAVVAFLRANRPGA